ncbi:MAG: diaminobutyrate acetyltransferase [Wenzhouxiangella sp.]|jgi:L-2,4-diaminobutyric acid acetyltransferase|nr:diaminobutyrate acetyltransferase [Wenzhouxiangella sp.]
MSPEAARKTPAQPAVSFRRPRAEDGAAMWRLVKDMGGLELNSAYFYVLFAKDFADTSIVAESDGGDLAGFIVGHRPPQRAQAVFVWQIGVAPWMRRQGLARRMLEALLAAQTADVRWLEATVSPDNGASTQLFRSIARDLGVECLESEYLGAPLFPSAHEAENLFRIGPLDKHVTPEFLKSREEIS